MIQVSQLFRSEIALGFLVASVFWVAILGWQAATAPSDSEKQKCFEAAERSGDKPEVCKSIWARTTSDPIAFFTMWLVIFTAGLTGSTILLWRAGEKQIKLLRRSTDAAINAQLPYMSYEISIVSNTMTRSPDSSISFRVSVDFENHAEWAAMINSVKIGYTVSPLLKREEERSSSKLPPRAFLLKGKPISIQPDDFSITLSTEEQNAIEAGETHLWVHGNLFFDTFANDGKPSPHPFNFCRRYIPANDTREAHFTHEGVPKEASHY